MNFSSFPVRNSDCPALPSNTESPKLGRFWGERVPVYGQIPSDQTQVIKVAMQPQKPIERSLSTSKKMKVNEPKLQMSKMVKPSPKQNEVMPKDVIQLPTQNAQIAMELNRPQLKTIQIPMAVTQLPTQNAQIPMQPTQALRQAVHCPIPVMQLPTQLTHPPRQTIPSPIPVMQMPIQVQAFSPRFAFPVVRQVWTIPQQPMELPERRPETRSSKLNSRNSDTKSEVSKITKIDNNPSEPFLKLTKETYRNSILKNANEKVYLSNEIDEGIFQHIVFANYAKIPSPVVKLQKFNIRIKNMGVTPKDKIEFLKYLKVTFIYSDNNIFSCLSPKSPKNCHVEIKDNHIEIEIPSYDVGVSEMTKPVQILRKDSSFQKAHLLDALKKISVSYILKNNRYFHTIPTFFISYSKKLRTNGSKWLTDSSCYLTLFENMDLRTNQLQGLKEYQPYILPVTSTEIKDLIVNPIVPSNKRKSESMIGNAPKKPKAVHRSHGKPDIPSDSLNSDKNEMHSFEIHENKYSSNEDHRDLILDDDPINEELPNVSVKPNLLTNLPANHEIPSETIPSLKPTSDLSSVDEESWNAFEIKNDDPDNDFQKFTDLVYNIEGSDNLENYF